LLGGCSRLIVHWEIRPKMEESNVETIIQGPVRNIVST
jgi:hypothetical protein